MKAFGPEELEPTPGMTYGPEATPQSTYVPYYTVENDKSSRQPPATGQVAMELPNSLSSPRFVDPRVPDGVKVAGGFARLSFMFPRAHQHHLENEEKRREMNQKKSRRFLLVLLAGLLLLSAVVGGVVVSQQADENEGQGRDGECPITLSNTF